MESEDFSSGPRVDPIPQKKLGPRRRRSRKKRRLAERNKAPRVSWQTLWLTDVPLRGRIPRSHACATRHIPLSFTFFPAVSLLLGILSTLTRQQPPLAQRRRASRALSRHFPLPSPPPPPFHPSTSCSPPPLLLFLVLLPVLALPFFSLHSTLLLFCSLYFFVVYIPDFAHFSRSPRPLRSMILPNWSSNTEPCTVFHFSSPLIFLLPSSFPRIFLFPLFNVILHEGDIVRKGVKIDARETWIQVYSISRSIFSL